MEASRGKGDQASEKSGSSPASVKSVDVSVFSEFWLQYKRNIWNTILFAWSCVFTSACLLGVLGPDVTEINVKYQTLMTPDSWTFLVWWPIFVSQGVFVYSMLQDEFRNDSIGQAGVAWYFVALCIFQTFWSCAYVLEVMYLATFFAFGMLFCSVVIVLRTYAMPCTMRTFLRLKAPFQLYAGWMMFFACLQLNMWYIQHAVVKSWPKTPFMPIHAHTVVTQIDSKLTTEQLCMAYAVFCLISIWSTGLYLALCDQPQAIILGVLSWTFGGISSLLRRDARAYDPSVNPRSIILIMYGKVTRGALQSTTFSIAVCAGIVFWLLCLKAFYRHGDERWPREHKDFQAFCDRWYDRFAHVLMLSPRTEGNNVVAGLGKEK